MQLLCYVRAHLGLYVDSVGFISGLQIDQLDDPNIFHTHMPVDRHATIVPTLHEHMWSRLWSDLLVVGWPVGR